MMNKRQIGAEKEAAAAEFLKQQGYRILERNFRSRTAEIDIIAKDGETLCFVEVKYRSTDQCGSGLEAVGYHKQKNICQAARYYMMKNHVSEWDPCRFDVVSIKDDEFELVKNAFEYIG